MSYRSVAEFVSERYHCDVPYLIELNGARKIAALKVRESVIVPNVTPLPDREPDRRASRGG